MPLAFIGIGSNLNDPVMQVKTAVTELAQLSTSKLIKQSSLYQTSPVGVTNQPDFINAVVLLETNLIPTTLLQLLQNIEKIHKRKRTIKWGQRTLDLDLLLYDKNIIDLPQLQIPHPLMHKRVFVLMPLAEIAPDLLIPNLTKTVSMLVDCNLSNQKIKCLKLAAANKFTQPI